MKYARIADGSVAEIIDVGSGDITTLFHPSVVAQCVVIPDLITGQVASGWLFDGEDFSAPPVVVQPVVFAPITARQLRLWLMSQERALTDVDAAIAALPEAQREPARVEWEYSTEYDRDHPLIAAIGAALGFTNDEIDAGFLEACVL